jgi:heat-inducible transcriptional repressor
MSPKSASDGGPRSSSHLSERDRRILAAVVRAYIEDGEPVSSLKLTSRGSFGVSSATLRNVLARLEDEGYLEQPHTSAGRVPTDQGYRAYVDLLLESRRVRPVTSDMELRLRQADTVQGLLTSVSHELSRLSHHIGFAVAPGNEAVRFKQIDFVPLADTRILVLVVTAGAQILQKVVDLGEPVRAEDLWQAANYLNTEFSGLRLAEVRAAVMDRLRQERILCDALMARALRLAKTTFGQIEPQETIFVEGASSLLDDALQGHDRLSLATLRSLLRMIEQKHRLLRLLNEYLDAPGLMVVIGTEHTVPELQSLSLVTSTYLDGQHTGTIGIIGPRRMRYSRTISTVDRVSRAVSRVLDHS